MKTVEQLHRFTDPQEFKKPVASPQQVVSGDVTLSHWRAVIDKDSTNAIDNQPLDKLRVMQGIIYGLVNIRSDGKRLLFAVRNEANKSWAYETIEDDEIQTAVSSKIDFA